MNSRREFFGVSSAVLAALNTAAATRSGQADSGSAGAMSPQRDYWNDLPNWMAARIAAVRERRKGDLAKLRSSAAADERNALIRARVWECIGGKIEQSPLNARITGTVERDAYRIEKIIFESQPSFYVPAHLYLPTSRAKPFPGIIAPLGHTPEGKFYRSYQTVFQNLARQGFAVLTWDPPGQGERLQYLDPATDRSTYGPTGEHDRFGWPALLIGSSTTQFELWDGVRALDYLVSRPEIDPQRIGCCGHSGGGTQTMFLCALEPRIKAAVVVEGHTENVAGADYQPPGAFADAEQNLIGGLKVAVDRGDLLGAFAPKPLLICYTPNDNGTTYSPHYVRGTEEIADELRNLYGLYECRDKVGLFHSTLPHDYDYFHRAATYGWFSKWLSNEASPAKEIPFETASETTLWCTSTGQVLTSLGGRSAFEINNDRLQAIKTAKAPEVDKAKIQTDLKKLLNLTAPSGRVRTTTFSSKSYERISIDDIEYESEPGIRVPGWFLKPSGAGSRLPVILILDDRGKDGLFDQWPLIQKFTSVGFAVCSVDPRTRGITKPHLPVAGPLFYGYGVELAYTLVNLTLGTPIVGQQTYDILRALDFLEAREDVDPKRIGVFATGTSGIASIAASVLDQRVRSLILNRNIFALESVVASRDYDLTLSAVAFGFLERFDLPELCAAIAPRPVGIVNAVDARGKRVPLSELSKSYGVSSLTGGDRPKNLSFHIEPDPIDSIILDWAKAFA